MNDTPLTPLVSLAFHLEIFSRHGTGDSVLKRRGFPVLFYLLYREKRNSKHEIRNSKQIQMIKIQMTETKKHVSKPLHVSVLNFGMFGYKGKERGTLLIKHISPLEAGRTQGIAPTGSAFRAYKEGDRQMELLEPREIHKIKNWQSKKHNAIPLLRGGASCTSFRGTAGVCRTWQDAPYLARYFVPHLSRSTSNFLNWLHLASFYTPPPAAGGVPLSRGELRRTSLGAIGREKEGNLGREEISFPNQDRSFPIQDISFPIQGTLFLREDISFPNQDTSFLREDISFPIQDISFPNQSTSLLNQDISFPNQGISLLNQDTLFLREDISFPIQDTSLPNRDTSLLNRDRSFPNQDINKKNRQQARENRHPGTEVELEYTPVRSPGAITAGTSASVSIGGQPLAEPGRTGIGGGAKSGHQTGMTQPTGTGIDMERLTGNVYRMLERRIRMERERRGW